jgi:glucose/arabinose dehydrogenase
VLQPEPLAGIPNVRAVGTAGLFDVVLHPKFAENKLVYFTYTKPGDNGQFATTLARGRLSDAGLTEVHDLFSGERNTLTGGSRIAFGPDGSIYMTLSATIGDAAQDPGSDYGKILRLRDDGSVPDDNPFVHRAGYEPEIFSMGHRDQLGLAFRPATDELYSCENGPNGGDKINLVLPGRNSGWPVVSYGRTNPGPRVSDVPWREGFEVPFVVWVPLIAPSGLTFYSGSQFPAWKGNLFVGGMKYGELPVTGRLERVVFNDKMEEIRRESLLTDLKQRIRDVRQGPDGFLYVLTEEEDGALLRIEPA